MRSVLLCPVPPPYLPLLPLGGAHCRIAGERVTVPAQPVRKRRDTGTNSRASPQSASRAQRASPREGVPTQPTVASADKSNRGRSLVTPPSTADTAVAVAANPAEAAMTSIKDPDLRVAVPTGLRTTTPKALTSRNRPPRFAIEPFLEARIDAPEGGEM